MEDRLRGSKIIMVKDIRDRRSEGLNCLVKPIAIGYYGTKRGNEAKKELLFFFPSSPFLFAEICLEPKFLVSCDLRLNNFFWRASLSSKFRNLVMRQRRLLSF